MRTLWRFTLPHTWNVASSLKTSFSANPCSSRRCWKSTQKCKILGIQRLQQLQPVSFHAQTFAQNAPNSWLRHLKLPARAMCWLLRASDKVSRTRSTVSADGPGGPVRFAAHRQPLCWNFMYHSRIVLSVGGSVWYMVRNLRCTVTINSVLANSKTQNTILFPVHAIFRHDCPLTVKPASTPRRLLPKQTWTFIAMLSTMSVLVVAQPSSEIPEGLMNYPVFTVKCIWS